MLSSLLLLQFFSFMYKARFTVCPRKPSFWPFVALADTPWKCFRALRTSAALSFSIEVGFVAASQQSSTASRKYRTKHANLAVKSQVLPWPFWPFAKAFLNTFSLLGITV